MIVVPRDVVGANTDEQLPEAVLIRRPGEPREVQLVSVTWSQAAEQYVKAAGPLLDAIGAEQRSGFPDAQLKRPTALERLRYDHGLRANLVLGTATVMVAVLVLTVAILALVQKWRVSG